MQTQAAETTRLGGIWLTFMTECLDVWVARVCLPLGAHALVGGDVDGIGDRLMAYCEAQISDGTCQILLHQNVL